MLTNRERFEMDRRRQRDVKKKLEKSMLKAFWGWIVDAW